MADNPKDVVKPLQMDEIHDFSQSNEHTHKAVQVAQQIVNQQQPQPKPSQTEKK